LAWVSKVEQGAASRNEIRKHQGAYLGHLNEVWAVAEAPDGEWILSGAKDGGLNMWPSRP
jgi:hypothetical protein